jgi:hypothetical protein
MELLFVFDEIPGFGLGAVRTPEIAGECRHRDEYGGCEHRFGDFHNDPFSGFP